MNTTSPLKPLVMLLSVSLTVANALDVPLPAWKHLSSRNGDLPEPNGGVQQTAAVVFDIDGDRIADVVIAERTKAPSLIWFRRIKTGWDKYVIDDTKQTPEAGGVFHDVDGDSDLDLVIGGDHRSDELWWYENPAPHFDPKSPWKKHLIKQGGGKAHHDQAIANFKGDGKAQLMFWNQGARRLFMAEIPDHPRTAKSWPLTELLDTSATKTVNKQEGMDVFDVDGDGKLDLLAGIYWFKHLGKNNFKPIQICTRPGRLAAGKFKPGKFPQIVVGPGDSDGPLLLIECQGEAPTDPKSWVSRDLLGRKVIHGHSLQLGDLNGDGHLDIFAAEMGQWMEGKSGLDNSGATAWILYGDGRGNFKTTVFTTGFGFHEARLADANGDGKLDVISKPYRWDTPRLDIWLNQGNPPGATGFGGQAEISSRPGGRQ